MSHHQHAVRLRSGPRLSVTEWGRPDATVTVVLTHGLALSSLLWEDVAHTIVTANPAVRVLAYDHRGHGSSTKTSATLETLADDLAELIEQLVPVGDVVLGGHSMGGMTIMALAERHPQLVRLRVTGVALVSTAAGNLLGRMRRVPGFWRLSARILRLTARVRPPSRPLFIARLGTRGGFGARPRRDDMNRTIRQAAQADPRSIAELSASILRHDRFAALAEFRDLDVAVLVGSRDRLTPVRATRAIGDHLPDSQVEVYPGAGHFLPYERREYVAAHLVRLTYAADITRALGPSPETPLIDGRDHPPGGPVRRLAKLPTASSVAPRLAEAAG